jgi:hypothetical protein
MRRSSQIISMEICNEDASVAQRVRNTRVEVDTSLMKIGNRAACEFMIEQKEFFEECSFTFANHTS